MYKVNYTPSVFMITSILFKYLCKSNCKLLNSQQCKISFYYVDEGRQICRNITRRVTSSYRKHGNETELLLCRLLCLTSKSKNMCIKYQAVKKESIFIFIYFYSLFYLWQLQVISSRPSKACSGKVC